MEVVNSPLHRVLWTGGWDSTYRLVELSRMDVTVQPIYVCDSQRSSMEIERQAMEKILSALRAHPDTRARLLPVQYVPLDAIPENPEITQAYQRLKHLTGLGDQYEWLARMAWSQPGLELGLEDAPQGGGSRSILEYGRIETQNGMAVLDTAHSTPECAAVFGNFRFPIFSTSEQDMLANVRQWGYEDVMALIWFCHNPLRGEPCGMCHPCRLKIESDMEQLLPPAARRRYRVYRKTENLFGKFPARVLAKLVYRPFV